MNKRNFLLGKGERLTKDVTITLGGGPKAYPYTFTEAKARLEKMLDNVIENIEKLPDVACPDDYAVATITLNPEFIAKSYYPAALLRDAGLQTVGSRPRQIKPEKQTKKGEIKETLTTELFVKGTRKQFASWSKKFATLDESSKADMQIREIEEIAFPQPQSKLKNIPRREKNIVYEVVLHIAENEAESRYLGLFKGYLRSLNIDTDLKHRFYAGGLCFVEVEASTKVADQIAMFSLVRVVRAMPKLRLLRPGLGARSYTTRTRVVLPDGKPLDTTVKAAIFDGGIPFDHPFTKWVTPFEFPGMLPADNEMFDHGVAVTSAFLFGHINPKKALDRPYSLVDHYRVIDKAPGQNPFELFEVLERINNVLQSDKQYDFINLSLGPRLPIGDDEVHVWTAVIDEYLSAGNTLATIAVGNDGDGDPSIGANRIQVPADCVNALSIGACDVPDDGWQRANYSSVGPGRSPGLIKPDLVDFGGSDARPFLVLDAYGGNQLVPTSGTSFSAPAALRIGAGIRAHFGKSLNSLAIKTLLIHCSESTNIPANEVGWGRVARNLDDIVICNDQTMRVVYQGKISASKYIRVPIPLPTKPLPGKIRIKATLCYATAIDPHHPDNYTRSGLNLFFRPDKTKFEDDATHPKTKSFFTKSNKNHKYLSESELRADAWKWENCMHGSVAFLGKSLNEPVFDIHYNARIEGQNDTKIQMIQYAMVISVEAPNVSDFYDQIVRKYATQLEALKPVIDIPIRTNV